MSIAVERPTMGAGEEARMRNLAVEQAKVEAQAFFTAVMTDTYIEPEDEAAQEVEDDE